MFHPTRRWYPLFLRIDGNQAFFRILYKITSRKKLLLRVFQKVSRVSMTEKYPENTRPKQVHHDVVQQGRANDTINQ